jgi:thioredoxin-like negative regulator of GroEL
VWFIERIHPFGTRKDGSDLRGLEVVRRDRAYGDDAARKAMLEVFALMGGEGPVVKHYRTLLSSLLY